jgi:hypothetical protein
MPPGVVADSRPPGFIEEQQSLTLLGLPERRFEVLLCLADPFRDDLGEVNLEQSQTEHSGDDFRGKGLACSGLTGEQGFHSACAAVGCEAPLFGHPGPGAIGRGEFEDHLMLRGRENKIPRSPSGGDYMG